MSPSNWLAPRALAELATRRKTPDQPPRQALVIPLHAAVRANINTARIHAERLDTCTSDHEPSPLPPCTQHQ